MRLLTKIQFREYRPEDREGCLGIFRSNLPRFFAGEEQKDLENWLDGRDLGGLSYGNTESEYFYIARDESGIIACGGFYFLRNENRANLVWGMVLKGRHGQGVGRRLLEYRIDRIRSLKPGIVLSLDTTQHTRGFFEKLGFTLTGIVPGYYGKDLDRYDMLLDLSRP
jgi:ribosomal protein S18 acetylase RimI-like enzyme